MASTRRLKFASVISDGSGITAGGLGSLKNERVTKIHRVWALQYSAAAEAEPARRKAVSVKVELRCSCRRESAQVEHERTCI